MNFRDSKPDQYVKQEVQDWREFKQEQFEINDSSDVSEFIEKLDDIIKIFKIMGTASAFEKMVFTKSTQLRRICNELLQLGLMK